MQPVDGDPSLRSGNRWARFVERNFLWLLVGCYVVATIWPGPGLAMKQWEWTPGRLSNQPLTLSLLLLTVMLFNAALLTDVARIRSIVEMPLLLCIALFAVWFAPAVLVVVAGWVVPWAAGGEATVGLLVGLALIAAMPVANSSVGWTQSAEGNLALSLALVVLSISLSPWATPQLLRWFGTSLAPAEQAYCEQLVTRFSGVFFIVWVLLPTALGFLSRYILTPRRITRVASWVTLASGAALLMLNYINSALALPKVRESPPTQLLAAAVLAAALSVVGVACGWGIALILRQPTESRSALMFGLSMKHTGLALILAGAVLHNQPLAMLMIVLATLMQHLLAGLVHWRLEHGDHLP